MEALHTFTSYTLCIILSYYFQPITSTAKCDSLEDPANGAVTVTGLYQGSTATYTCVPTHELVGESVRTCTSNGLWTPAEPTCARKHL